MELVDALPGLGLLSWLLAGALGGLSARRLPPTAHRTAWVPTLGCGAGGGFLAGLAATGLGFGGILAPSGPAIVVAALAGALALLLYRLAAAPRER